MGHVRKVIEAPDYSTKTKLPLPPAHEQDVVAAALSKTLDEKGLEELAEKANAMKPVSSASKTKVEVAESFEDETMKSGAELVDILDIRTSDAEAKKLLTDEHGERLHKHDASVDVTTAEDAEPVIEDHPPAVIYGIVNDGSIGDALKRPARNIRWNLQRPPSVESQQDK